MDGDFLGCGWMLWVDANYDNADKWREKIVEEKGLSKRLKINCRNDYLIRHQLAGGDDKKVGLVFR